MNPSDDYLKDLGGRRYMRRQRRLRELRDEIRAKGSTADELESQGVQALEGGDYDVAEVYLKEACSSRGEATAMARFGQILERAHEPDRALKAYEYALSHGMRNPAVGLKVASLLERKRRFDEANRVASQFLTQLAEGSEDFAAFTELRRRVETKLGLRRKLDNHRRGEEGREDGSASSPPEAALASWLDALEASDRPGFLSCYASDAQSVGAADFERLEALRGASFELTVTRSASEGAQRHLRGHIGPPEAGRAFEAWLARAGDGWRLKRILLASSPATGTAADR